MGYDQFSTVLLPADSAGSGIGPGNVSLNGSDCAVERRGSKGFTRLWQTRQGPQPKGNLGIKLLNEVDLPVFVNPTRHSVRTEEDFVGIQPKTLFCSRKKPIDPIKIP